jgi:hypothetical protein
MRDLNWSNPTVKAPAAYHGGEALPANASRHGVSLLLAPPECLFKPTHCSANWITLHVKIDLLKQQQQRQIKTAATAKVQRHGGLGEGKIKGALHGRKLIFWFPGGVSVLCIFPLPCGPFFLPP